MTHKAQWAARVLQIFLIVGAGLAMALAVASGNPALIAGAFFMAGLLFALIMYIIGG